MTRIGLKETVSILKAARDKKVMITFHSMGDTDSVASAVALSRLLNDSVVSMPDSITRNAANILKKLGISAKFDKEFRTDAELVIMLDVNNFGGCGAFEEPLKERKRDILIIDHHAPEEIPAASVMSFDDESYNSTSSMVYEIIKELGADISKNGAKLIALGIISDSAEFKNASYQTFAQLAELFARAETSYIRLQEDFHKPPLPEHRLEMLADLCHSNSDVISNMLFIHGRSKGHASEVADLAINMGADASIFYSENESEVAVSARLRPTLDEKYGIHLGIMMRNAARIIGGSGGGHPCAAGAYGPEKDKADEIVAALISGISGKITGNGQRGKR